MDRRLVYGLMPKFKASSGNVSQELEWCGMLREEDINGIGLRELPQYHFEPQNNLSAANLKIAKRLHIGFIWQKFNTIDDITNTSIVFQRLLFIDYETETQRKDYPELANPGVYYEVGELLPYIRIDQDKEKAMLYGDSDFLAYQIEDVLLNINDPKYQSKEYQDLFASEIIPFQRWFASQEKKYHYSLTHQSYSHSLFMSLEEWETAIVEWKQGTACETTAANAQIKYELLLKKQINRINYEMVRALSAIPKDHRTISGFKEQLYELRDQVIKLYRKIPKDLSAYDQELDDIISFTNSDDGEDNALALQDLIRFIINKSKAANEADAEEISLDDFVTLKLTTHQSYNIFNISIIYFLSSLDYAENSNTYKLDSHDRNLIAFAAQALIVCLVFLVAEYKTNLP